MSKTYLSSLPYSKFNIRKKNELVSGNIVSGTTIQYFHLIRVKVMMVLVYIQDMKSYAPYKCIKRCPLREKIYSFKYKWKSMINIFYNLVQIFYSNLFDFFTAMRMNLLLLRKWTNLCRTNESSFIKRQKM